MPSLKKTCVLIIRSNKKRSKEQRNVDTFWQGYQFSNLIVSENLILKCVLILNRLLEPEIFSHEVSGDKNNNVISSIQFILV